MQDLLSMTRNLRRPRLLIRAARIGAEDYRRERHLARLLGYGRTPRPGEALIRLMELEQVQDERRCAEDAGYSLSNHVELLIAILGESRLLARPVLQTEAALPG